MRVFALTIVYLSLVVQTGICQAVRIEPALEDQFNKSEQVECILYFKDRFIADNSIKRYSKEEKAIIMYNKLVEKSEQTQKEIISYLQNRGFLYQSFYVTNAIKTRIDIKALTWLKTRHEVDWIFYNQPVKLIPEIEEKTTQTSRFIEPEWGIKMIKADSVWSMGYRGQGVVVGGQDTGYSWEVSPLRNKYKGYIDSTTITHNYHWHDAIHEANDNFPDSLVNPCGYNLEAPCDDNDHGTHTMGTMVGEDSENSIGVAPEAKWIGCRNMERGWGSPASYLECFEWFLAPYDISGNNPDPTKAPHVINNSWYCSTEEGCNLSNFYLINDAVTNLRAAGVVVVVSAGNSGKECSTINAPPAIFENAFTIGATTEADTIARFSSRGLVTIDTSFRLKPNVSAPGARVRSVIRNGSFANFSGTSMAGPHVVGLVALLISANPGLAGKVDEIEDIIESTAEPKMYLQDCNNFSGDSIPNAVYGYGRINAFAAVQKALLLTSTIQSDKTGLKIYPNPSAEDVYLVLQNTKISSVFVYDAQGKLVFSEPNVGDEILKININHFYKGVYFVRVLGENGKWVLKSFIKHDGQE